MNWSSTLRESFKGSDDSLLKNAELRSHSTKENNGLQPVAIDANPHSNRLDYAADRWKIRKRPRPESQGNQLKTSGAYDNNRVYRDSLRQILEFVLHKREDFAALLTEDEHKLSETLLTKLDDDALGLVARLLHRKGPWFRLSELQHRYFSHYEPSEAANVLQQTVKTLSKTGVVQIFDASSTFDDALSVANMILNKAELQRIVSSLNLCRIRAKGNCSAPNMPKKKALELISKCKSQISVFGGCIPLVKHVCAVVPGGILSISAGYLRLIEICMTLSFLYDHGSMILHSSSIEAIDAKRKPVQKARVLNHGLLQDFGLLKFEAYEMVVSQPLFPCRQHFNFYLAATYLLDMGERLIATSNSVDLAEKEYAAPILSNSLSFQDFASFENNARERLLVDLLPYDYATLLQCFIREFDLWFTEKSKKDSFVRPLFLDQFSAKEVLCVALAKAVEMLEKRKEYDKAASLWEFLLCYFPKSRRRGYWWNRLYINLKHVSNYSRGVEALTSCLSDDSISSYSIYRVEARKRLQSLLHRKSVVSGIPETQRTEALQIFNTAKTKASLSSVPVVELFGRTRTQLAQLHSDVSKPQTKPRLKCEYICANEQDTSRLFDTVENFVIEHYELEGEWSGIHCEGSIFRSLFALFMWDAIFCSSVADVFQTQFQDAPLDLTYSHGMFLDNRKILIQKIMDSVKSSSRDGLACHVRKAWKLHNDVTVIGHSWNRYSCFTLESIAACLGGDLLAAILQRLVEDFRHWSGGVPDLLLRRIILSDGTKIDDMKNNGQDIVFKEDWTYDLKFIEVKSKNDRLSEKQISWITYLNENGADAAVCRVSDKLQTASTL